MKEIADNIAKVRARIQQAAQENQRDANQITVLAASKTRSPDEILLAYESGLCNFGENYVQEALPKIEALSEYPLTWHYIGPLQSNKSKSVAEHFDWVHSVDRLKTAEKLNQHRPSHLPPINVCLQVNINSETSKSGAPPEEIQGLITSLAKLEHLNLRGLMAIPDPNQPADQLESTFASMATLLQKCQQHFPNLQLDTLSMGMSGDLELAVVHGTTLVRIGQGIFGPRQNKQPDNI